MNQTCYTVVNHCPLTKDVFALKLAGDTSMIAAPGQFVNLQVPGHYLRRPISVCAWDDGALTLIIRRVGSGTDALSQMQPGARIDALVGLGNGFDVGKSGCAPLLVGGGVGVAPLYALAKALIARGVTPLVALGYNCKAEVLYEREFASLGARVFVYTVDGSSGTKGFVTDSAKRLDYSYFYACGPTPMLNALECNAKTDGEYSLEARMGCGFGACMGCSIETKQGARRVCKEGPVFGRSDLIWPIRA